MFCIIPNHNIKRLSLSITVFCKIDPKFTRQTEVKKEKMKTAYSIRTQNDDNVMEFHFCTIFVVVVVVVVFSISAYRPCSSLTEIYGMSLHDLHHEDGKSSYFPSKLPYKIRGLFARNESSSKFHLVNCNFFSPTI